MRTNIVAKKRTSNVANYRFKRKKLRRKQFARGGANTTGPRDKYRLEGDCANRGG